jgi:hypothetical protein
MLAKESSITHPQSKFAKMDEKSNKNELATPLLTYTQFLR